MSEHKELLDALDALQEASAKCRVLTDLCEYLHKYRRKLDNQLKEITRKYEKAKKSDNRNMEFYRIMTKREQLQCQMIETLRLEKEFLERHIKAGSAEIEAHDHLKEVKDKAANNAPQDEPEAQ